MLEKCLEKRNNIQGFCEYTKGYNDAVYRIFFLEEGFQEENTFRMLNVQKTIIWRTFMYRRPFPFTRPSEGLLYTENHLKALFIRKVVWRPSLYGRPSEGLLYTEGRLKAFAIRKALRSSSVLRRHEGLLYIQVRLKAFYIQNNSGRLSTEDCLKAFVIKKSIWTTAIDILRRTSKDLLHTEENLKVSYVQRKIVKLPKT